MDLIGLIPAAGLGSRMGHSGGALPKALIEIEGKPLLDHAIHTLNALGASKIIVVVGHLESAIREHLTAHDWNIAINIVRQERALGLANAIAVSAPELNSDFVVLCPDNIFTDASDLADAYDYFRAHEAEFLLVTTVTPNEQRDRANYHLTSRKHLAPNLYDYRPHNEQKSGPGVYSTGCVFFKRSALAFLPSFIDHDQEHKFRDYLEAISAKKDSLIYLLRGMRYDFSSPEDVKQYEQLKDRLSRTVGQGVSAILMNSTGQILMQQRDDNPAIRYPGHWSLFGGSIEDGESAVDAVVREVFEEINFKLENVGLFREFVQNNKREFAFVGEISASLDELTLNEGQGMNFFSPSQLPALLIRPDDKETLEEFFGVKHDR